MLASHAGGRRAAEPERPRIRALQALIHSAAALLLRNESGRVAGDARRCSEVPAFVPEREPQTARVMAVALPLRRRAAVSGRPLARRLVRVHLPTASLGIVRAVALKIALRERRSRGRSEAAVLDRPHTESDGRPRLLPAESEHDDAGSRLTCACPQDGRCARHLRSSGKEGLAASGQRAGVLRF
jgi:hypothetical protein